MKYLLVLALAISLQAGEVFKTKSGKSFHKSEKCITLSRTHEVIQLDSAKAAKELKPCGMCYRKNISSKIIIRK